MTGVKITRNARNSRIKKSPASETPRFPCKQVVKPVGARYANRKLPVKKWSEILRGDL